MDRFSWCDGLLTPDENLVVQQNGVRLYDGEEKTAFDSGNLILTSHQLLWRDQRDQECVLSLPLSLVVLAEEEPSGFAKSAKIVCHLSAAPTDKPSGPVTSSKHDFVRFSFKDGGQIEFYRNLQDMLGRRLWEQTPKPAARGKSSSMRAGIVGIERNMQQRHKATDKNISAAFEDLSNLMEKAKDMVTLSKSISNKIKDKQGEITEDETVKFKSYLLSLGISDPVTKDSHGTGDKYYKELAKELAKVLVKPIQDSGGMITLTDVYCRVNRARGLELLSPEDLLEACKMLEPMKLPVVLRRFDTGVAVLQLRSHNEEEVAQDTQHLVSEKGSVTAEELSKAVGVSVILAKERLLCTERMGRVCRDESIEGLRFYPNRFLTEPT